MATSGDGLNLSSLQLLLVSQIKILQYLKDLYRSYRCLNEKKHSDAVNEKNWSTFQMLVQQNSKQIEYRQSSILQQRLQIKKETYKGNRFNLTKILTPAKLSNILIQQIKMISAQQSSNNGKNWQKLSYQKILLAW